MEICERFFTTVRDGLTIQGKVFTPGGSHLPVIIVSHGFTGDMRETEPYARQLAALGYLTLCFDFCGGCLQGRSEGSTTDMSVLTEVCDLMAVIRYAQALPEADGDRISLMGFSQGGFVSALTAAKLKEQIEKLILVFPAFCIPDDSRKGQMLLSRFDPHNIPDVIECGAFRMGRIYPEAVLDMDPYKEVTEYQGPVLILHGTDDRIVDISYAEKAAAAYGEHATLKTILDAGHGFRPEEDLVAMGFLAEFLQDRREILTIHVSLTGKQEAEEGELSVLTLPFEGFARGEYFRGIIEPGAADVQRRRGEEIVRFCADYRITGEDYAGHKCTIHVINVNEGSGWKPQVTTDSEALSFLNGDQCSAVLEYRSIGPVVHIFCK